MRRALREAGYEGLRRVASGVVRVPVDLAHKSLGRHPGQAPRSGAPSRDPVLTGDEECHDGVTGQSGRPWRLTSLPLGWLYECRLPLHSSSHDH